MSREARATQREAFERRVWRLALLLTGDADGASKTLTAVARTARDLARIDAVRLDHLAVLHSREVMAQKRRRRAGADDVPLPEGPAARTLGALMEMKPQAREAWVLTRIDELDEIHVARAMDASKTASANFYGAADTLIRERLDDDADAGVQALREWATSFDPDPWLLIHRERVKRWRRIKLVAALVFVGLVVLVGVIIAATV
jgi:hypothetical protein